jgi:hypothetical protein
VSGLTARRIDTGIATLEFVFSLGARKLMQNGLHHGELVEISIEQTGDDHRSVF